MGSSNSIYGMILLNLWNFESTARPIVLLEIPEKLPVLQVIPLPLPSPLSEVEFNHEGDWLISPEQVRGRGPEIQVNALSGAVYAVGQEGGFAEGKALSEKEYLERAMSYLIEQGWQEEFAAEPTGASIRIQSVPVEGKSDYVEDVQKSVLISPSSG